MNHKYQLVFQIPEDHESADLDLEDDIAEIIGNSEDNPSLPHFVDGNSYGGGTMEFFVHTNDPEAAFELAKPLFSSHGLLGVLKVAYRDFASDDFQVIWPGGFTGVFTPF